MSGYVAPNRLLMPGRHSIDSLADAWLYLTGSPSAAVWPTANLAIYVPIRISSRVVVQKFWFGSGSAGSGNVDMGLYDAAGVAVISVATAAKGAANTEQVIDVTDTAVGPGLYYIGLSSDSGTDTYSRWSLTAPSAAAAGVYTEAAAYPLPSTATFALDQANTYVPLVGLLLEATVA